MSEEKERPSWSYLSWNCKIPVMISLCEEDKSTPEDVPVLYFNIPRHHSLYLVMEEIMSAWRHVLPGSSGRRKMWLEYKSLPLRWDVPAGVLYDLLHLVQPHASSTQHNLDCTQWWRIRAHFSNFPSAIIPKFTGIDCIRNSMFNSLKEASFVRLGSAQRVMTMVPRAQEDLWSAVKSINPDSIDDILNSLRLEDIPSSNDQAIPVRIWMKRVGGYVSGYDGVYQTSRSLTNGERIRDMIMPIILSWMRGQDMGTTKSNLWDECVHSFVHGARLTGDEPAWELWNQLHGPDGFLYVSIQVALE